MTPFQQRDFVRITCDGRTVDGVVTMAAPDGRLLVVAFDALLAGHAGTMPIFQASDGSFHSIITNAPVQLAPLVH